MSDQGQGLNSLEGVAPVVPGGITPPLFSEIPYSRSPVVKEGPKLVRVGSVGCTNSEGDSIKEVVTELRRQGSKEREG